VAKSNPIAEAQDLQKMLVNYAKQETVEPFKTLGNYLKWGILGALFIFLGAFFTGLGVLRLLQTETGSVFSKIGASGLPYLITIVVLGLGIAALVGTFLRAKKEI
jgi:hypothetical protein